MAAVLVVYTVPYLVLVVTNFSILEPDLPYLGPSIEVP